jgi:DNA-binding LacI/PurR family transcriptional regulator
MQFESVNLNDSKPLGMQITEILEQKIKSSEIAVGEKLPTQNELCRIFNVSIDTVLGALSNLVEEGYINRRPRYGTFVISSEPRKGLDLKRKNEIGVVVCINTSDPAPLNPNSNMRYYNMLMGLDQILKGKGLHMIYTTMGEDSGLSLLEKDGIAGLILAGATTPRIYRMVEKAGIPFVMIGDMFTGEKKNLKVDIIADDDFQSAYIATKHLVELGHRRIAYLTCDLKYPWKREELEGYRKALEDSKIAFDKDLLLDAVQYSYEAGYNILKKAFEKPVSFTGMVGADYNLCYAAMDVFKEKGLKVPGDISLIALGIIPDLTAVIHDMGSSSTTALERLLGRLNNPDWKPERITMTPKLIVKNTTRKI